MSQYNLTPQATPFCRRVDTIFDTSVPLFRMTAKGEETTVKIGPMLSTDPIKYLLRPLQ